jgi:prepilin-type N-terminal cleavage/methylation domain-containing protein
MSRRQGVWQHEHGFTLAEVLITIIIMGILFGIASSTWFGVVESRRVDSATNQVASELRLAHIRATNRLENWQVDPRPPAAPSTNTYRIGPCADPCAAPLPGSVPLRSLEEGSGFPPGMSGARVVFNPNGEAELFGLAENSIQVAADDGSPCHEIEVNETTSRIRVVTGYNNVCVD